MKKIFKLVILIFSGIFFITKSWGFAVAGRHYAYVSAGSFGESATLTRYQIDANGNFINPIAQHVYNRFMPRHYRFSGVAVAPDRHYIYVAYGPLILSMHLNDGDRTLDRNLNLQYHHVFDDSDRYAKSLVVSKRYNKLYVITHNPFDRKIYSFDINEHNNDTLENMIVFGPLIPELSPYNIQSASNEGISVADNGTIFINTEGIPTEDSEDDTNNLIISILPVDFHGNIIGDGSSNYVQQAHKDLQGSKYIPRGRDTGGLLVISNGYNGLATLCGISPINVVRVCLKVSNHTSFNFDHHTYDVDMNPDNPNILYFTSGRQIFRWDITHRDHEPVSMPSTSGVPSKNIVTF